VPKFSTLTTDEVADIVRRRTSALVDLTEYKGWIDEVLKGSGWGRIEVDASDNVRALKRRTSIAAKELGKIVKWNRRSDAEKLIFQVIGQEEQQRRTRRPRRKKSG
jgi:hypothetical protein